MSSTTETLSSNDRGGKRMNNKDDTIFNTAMSSFPVADNGRINTREFLEASKGVSLLVEKFGTVFTPIKYDLNQNIEKIETKFKEDEVKFKYLDDLVTEESKTSSIIVKDALQWLRRGLHFTWYYFDLTVKSEDENCSSHMKIAYENTLRPYHGWISQQFFNLIVKFTPSRSDLLEVCALNQKGKDKLVVNHMRLFLINLKICIDHLVQFYLTNGYECTNRV